MFVICVTDSPRLDGELVPVPTPDLLAASNMCITPIGSPSQPRDWLAFQVLNYDDMYHTQAVERSALRSYSASEILSSLCFSTSGVEITAMSTIQLCERRRTFARTHWRLH